jgi:hypothetical protein
VQSPKALNLVLDVDAGELEAICLAQEIRADAVLMDDRAGRNAAIHCGLAVVGTIGILEQAAVRGLIELVGIYTTRQHLAGFLRWFWELAMARCPF